MNDIIGNGILVTLQLGVMAFLLSVAIGLPLGIIAALGHNRVPDYSATFISVIGISTPTFVSSILLIVIFSVTLGWLPTNSLKLGDRPDDLDPADHRPVAVPDRPDRALHPGLDARGHPA